MTEEGVRSALAAASSERVSSACTQAYFKHTLELYAMLVRGRNVKNAEAVQVQTRSAVALPPPPEPPRAPPQIQLRTRW